MPPLRLAILDDVAAHPGASTAEVRKRVGKPRATVDRELQALHMLDALTTDEEEEVRAGRLTPGGITAATIAKHLYDPQMPDVDLFLRSSGEHRTSNFLLWQSAYAELDFPETLWPDFDRRHLWAALERYAGRDRRFGGAVDRPQEQSEQRP